MHIHPWNSVYWRTLLTLVGICVLALFPMRETAAQRHMSPGFAETGQHLSKSAQAGREIWFFATAFNDRFFTYAYPQRLGATIDWFSILAAKNQAQLFNRWGAIPNPDCCMPGDAGCPAKSLDETYGFMWCPGDSELLEYVGKQGYRDPACDFVDGPFDMSTPHGDKDQRQDSCDLRFGTSTGALGLRKFPNPRFDRERWMELNGSLSDWKNYPNRANGADGEDFRSNRLFDASVEPPFRIGMACGACHIAYDPLNPPQDPANPAWENIKGLIGNQYSRISQLLGSGLSKNLLEWQLIARSRPGVVDTSALPMDTVHNPGTMNVIYNFARRPTFEHRVLKWRKTNACEKQDIETCWCEPGKDQKCWERTEKTEPVHHILKGGEDNVGALEAIQRVYFNIGSCAEQCWLNHLPDLRALDPSRRNAGQTPMRIGQCRRDCASFRAIEDRLGDVADFFFAERPTDLWQARGLASRAELETQLETEFGEGSIALGRDVFAKTCAQCHSSQPEPHEFVDFHETVEGDPTLRKDFLSNEFPYPVTDIGTYAGRAMHSNHMPGRVWEQYAALDLRERKSVEGLKEITKDNGRGYYRPPSLLSVWAHAPFMHNNAIGPELCGKGTDDLYVSPYVDENNKPMADPPACLPFDPSVEGRYDLFKKSIRALLYPETRLRKVNLTDEDIIFDIAPNAKIADIEIGLSIKIPQGYPVVRLNSLRFKDLVQDLVLVRTDESRFDAKYQGRLSDEQHDRLKTGLSSVIRLIGEKTKALIDMGNNDNSFIQAFYSNVLDYEENAGHTFGSKLSDREKNALIAFLATL